MPTTPTIPQDDIIDLLEANEQVPQDIDLLEMAEQFLQDIIDSLEVAKQILQDFTSRIPQELPSSSDATDSAPEASEARQAVTPASEESEKTARKSSLSMDKLMDVLAKRSSHLSNLMGDSFDTQFPCEIAATLFTLQEQYGVNLIRSDVGPLRRKFLDPKTNADVELMEISLDVMQILQNREPYKKPQKKVAAVKAGEESQFFQDHTYGFVVLQGDHHTIASGTMADYEILFDRSVHIANKHSRGGQSQNRFARLAEQSRVHHLNIIYDRMSEAFRSDEGGFLVDKVIIAGPGPMKHQLLDHVPDMWKDIIDRNPMTTDRVGHHGMHELTGVMLERSTTVSRAEQQRQRQRLRKLDRKDVKGQERGGGRKDRQE